MGPLKFCDLYGTSCTFLAGVPREVFGVEIMGTILIIYSSNSIIAFSKQFKSDCKRFSHFFYLYNFSFNKLLSFYYFKYLDETIPDYCLIDTVTF